MNYHYPLLVIGSFESRDAIEELLRALRAAGFRDEMVSIAYHADDLAKDPTDEPQREGSEKMRDLAKGAVSGGVEVVMDEGDIEELLARPARGERDGVRVPARHLVEEVHRLERRVHQRPVQARRGQVRRRLGQVSNGHARRPTYRFVMRSVLSGPVPILSANGHFRNIAIYATG